MENVLRDAVTYTEHARRKTVAAMDVVHALRRHGITYYGAAPAGAWGMLDDGCGAGQRRRVDATNAHRRDHERLRAAARRAGLPPPPPPPFEPYLRRAGCRGPHVAAAY